MLAISKIGEFTCRSYAAAGGSGMSYEAGVVALEAVQDGMKQNPLAQPEMATNQALIAQRFDVDLNRAAEASATELQTGEASRGKSNETSRESFKTADIPEVEARSAISSHTTGGVVVSYLNGFSQKANGLVSDLHRAVGSAEEVAPVQGAPVQAPSPESGPGTNMATSLQFMVRTFEVSVEAHFVANAARESVSTFNSLMKGQ
jgi:hypothetical protein